MVTASYVYGISILEEHGVESRFSTGAYLKHKGDYVLFKGMAPLSGDPGTYGSIIRITHIWEAGDIDKLPADYVLELKPGETYKVVNLEGADGRPRYNIRMEAEGAMYESGVYQGYKAEEPPEDKREEERAYGPFMTFLLSRPLLGRLLSGRAQ